MTLGGSNKYNSTERLPYKKTFPSFATKCHTSIVDCENTITQSGLSSNFWAVKTIAPINVSQKKKKKRRTGGEANATWHLYKTEVSDGVTLKRAKEA